MAAWQQKYRAKCTTFAAMSLRIAIGVCVLMLSNCLTSQNPFDCDGQFYIVLNQLSEQRSRLYRLNTGTNGLNQLSQISHLTRYPVNAMGFNPVDHYIYGTNTDNNELYRINRFGGLTVLAQLPGDTYVSGDVTQDGRYLVLVEVHAQYAALINLQDPAYPLTYINLSMTEPDPQLFCTDVAFHPYDGLLYGYDGHGRKLFYIDIQTGQLNNSSFPGPQTPGLLPALFFDTFGRLFGVDEAVKNIYQIDTQTGMAKQLETIDEQTGSKDGCSCPYFLKLEKDVWPRRSFSCQEVAYTFRIANLSGWHQQAAVLEDQLPEGMEIIEIVYNPFTSSTLASGVGSDFLKIENIELPVDVVDSIVIKVYVNEQAGGQLSNQARLTNLTLPQAVNNEVLSDDPTTLLAYHDSTRLYVVDAIFSFDSDTLGLCPNGSLLLNPNGDPDADYLWQDGSTEPSLLVTQPGTYIVEISAGCSFSRDTAVVEYRSINLPKRDSFNLCRGASLELEAAQDYGFPIHAYSWSDGSSGSSLLVDEPGIYVLELEYDCGLARDSFFVRFAQQPIDLPNRINTLCRNGTLVLSAQNYPAAIDKLIWNTGATQNSIEVGEEGLFTLEAHSECFIFYDTIEVKFKNWLLTAGPDITIEQGEELELNARHTAAGQVRWQWQSVNGTALSCQACSSPIVQPLEDEQFIVMAVDEESCSVSDTLLVKVDKTRPIYIPNVFTPDGDGINDQFFIYSKRAFIIRKLQIFDRWGGLVFELSEGRSNDSRFSWDGRSGDKRMPQGVYVWRAVLEFVDGTVEQKAGEVSLVY